MNFYKILKIKKLGRGSPDFWSRLFAKHTGGGSIKPVIVELTGRLPLTFITSDTKLHDWTLYGNNEPGKNLLEITAKSQTVTDVDFTVNTDGTITASGTTVNGQRCFFVGDVTLKAGEQYIMSGSPVTSSEAATRECAVYVYSHSNFGICVGQDVALPIQSQDLTVTIAATIYGAASSSTSWTKTFKPMIRKSGTSEAFEPYQIGVGERTKNLLEITGKDELVTRGIVFTHDKSDHTIGVNGQATGNAFYTCGDVTLKAGVQYVLSGCPSGGGISPYIYQIYLLGHSDWGGDYGDGFEIPVQTDDTVVTPRIAVYTGAGEVTDLIFKPMIREANTTSDFMPHGYQVPIESKRRTKNHFNKDAPYIASKYLNALGEEVSKSTWGISEYIPIEGNTMYTAYNLSGSGASACWYDKNKTYIDGKNYGGAAAKSFSLPSNAKYIRLTIRLINPPNTDTLMLIKGDTEPEDYIPYYSIIEKNIYIGDSLLIEGQAINRNDVDADIPTYDEMTVLDTTIYNKPEMTIKYKTKGGN